MNSKFVNGLPDGFETQVGERGARIRTGQCPWLRIARAVFTQPYLLVLEEANSSLDDETYASISDAVHSLCESTIVPMIALRLSTIRSADIAVYVSEGKMISKGSIDLVRNSVSEFDH